MAETENGADTAAAPAAGDGQATPRLRVLSQYIRDLSFENIAAQKSITQSEVKPDIRVQVNIDAARREDSRFEVMLKLNVEATAGSEKVFLLELDYAGLFHIENVQDAQLHPFLMIECPRMIFPYLRRVVGDITRDGGFPPLNIDNIDFLQLYRQEVERRRAAQGGDGDAAGSV
ncbi:MAG: protein-export chaperone SecB [Pseudomonadota bacterium]